MADHKAIDPASLLKRFALRHSLARLDFDGGAFECLNPSFSLAGEDLFLRKRLKDKLSSRVPGKYVDVGSFHPFFASNTYLFYVYGWSGICIDANPQFPEAFAKLRPRDVFVHAAVAEYPRDSYFAKYPGNTGMSQVFESPDEVPDEFGEAVKVPCVRLDTTLEAHFESGDVIDLMSIDIEDADLGALKSNDWTRFRPRMLCVEDRAAPIENPVESPLVAYLVERGYAICAVTPPNVFFEDTAHHPIP